MAVVELTKEKLALAVLISGRGSNLQSIIDACAAPDFPAQIDIVISNVPGAHGLKRAEDAGIPTMTINHKEYASRVAFDMALADVLDDYNPDLICLAGFMRILTPEFVGRFPHKIINIHPSLLPKYKGVDTHKRAIAAGDKEAGCSVHWVTEELDGGDVIIQKLVPILDGDCPQTLAARVLEQEHVAYPEAIRLVAQSRLKI